MELPPIVDFDPSEDIVFPRTVTPRLASAPFMAEIRRHTVNPGKVAMWHLGNNGWILKDDQGTLTAIDPYLTDFCASQRTGVRKPKSRILPVFIEPEDFDVDLVVITHSHCDHCDPWTLERLKCRTTASFLAPWQALKVIEDCGIPRENRYLMHPLQTTIIRGVEVTGAFAEPTDFSDLNHMGFVFRFHGDRVYYNSGDTAKTELLAHVRSLKPEWMSICINGGYHNLSHWEAAEICALIQPKLVLPAHYDTMPHNLQPPHMFQKSLFEKARDVAYLRLEYFRAYEF
jgi:L-ascorbate 6-phosphate lactonase